MQKEARKAIWRLKRQTKSDNRGRTVLWSWEDVGKFLHCNRGMAWRYAKGRVRIPPEILGLLIDMKLIDMKPKIKRAPVNWFKREKYLRRAIRRVQRSAIEAAAKIIDGYISAYDPEIFIPPQPGQHAETVSGCSAAALRAVLPNVARDVRNLNWDGEEWVAK